MLTTAQIVQLLSAVGGVVFSAVVGYRAADQQRRHSQVQSLVEALQADNSSLRAYVHQLEDDKRALYQQLQELRKQYGQ